jgi:predicted RNA-binding protein with PIN domain
MPYWFDGNNLIGQSAVAAGSDTRVRDAFLSTLSNYRKAGGGRFLVYFDGDDPDRAAPPPGIEIRYSAPLSADKVIVQRLKEIRNPSEIIVVSNDRELKSLCRRRGAATMTWHEFVTKRKGKFIHLKADRQEEGAVDVEDWMRYFGLHKTKPQ